jgi:energy-coupling factor transport system permease protein
VNFLFFAGAIVLAVVIQHPAYLLAGLISAMVYYLLLNGRKGWKLILGLVPLFAVLTAINPFFNTLGATPICYIWDRPYTLEALYYGGAVAAVFVIMILWFGCYNKVLTSDKFTSLFGNLIPAVSLLLVMVLRMIPNLFRRTKAIAGARKAIGKGAGESKKEKMREGMTVLGALAAGALEDGVITADSMRARGYGTARRSSFMIYRMKPADWFLLGLMSAMLALSITAVCLGQTGAVFVPALKLSPPGWGLACYSCYLLIPTALHIKEAVQWRISRSKI